MVEDKRMESQMKFRLSAEMKQQIQDYCEQHNITASEFIRFAVNKIFEKEDSNFL